MVIPVRKDLRLIHLQPKHQDIYLDVADIFMNTLGTKFKTTQVLFQRPQDYINKTIACLGNERVLGGLTYSFDTNFECYNIDCLAVSPHKQGNGIGRALVNEFEVMSRSRSINTFRVQIDEEVLNFYKKLGYLEVPNSSSDGCFGKKVLWMEKRE